MYRVKWHSNIAPRFTMQTLVVALRCAHDRLARVTVKPVQELLIAKSGL